MKTLHHILTLAFVCTILSTAFAEPFGIITYSIRTSTDFRVAAVNVASGEKVPLAVQTISSLKLKGVGPMPFNGVGAPPFFGDPCVVQASSEQTVNLLDFEGTMTVVVPAASYGQNTDPCFSFNGDRIAYVQRNASVSNEDVLFVANYDGSGDTPIYTTPLWGVDIERPFFSPDGNTLAFTMNDSHLASWYIYTVPVTGGVPQEMTSLPVGAMHPAYSPDGKKLACVSQYGGGTFHLCIANADGSNPQQITSGGSFALFPVFSPDSKYIAIMSDNGISIIDLSNNQIVKEIPLDYHSYFGMTWSLGAHDSGGLITKAKINSKSILLKPLGLVPDSAPDFGLIKIDNIFMSLDDASLWSDKKGKKFIYKDKANKCTAKYVVKNAKGNFKAKKLLLVEGTDYRLNTNITVVINVGNQTMVNTIQLDEKGKYKAPK